MINRVSVIIPTYRRVNYLKEAVKSVLSQTYKSFEIIIVNDDPSQKEEIDVALSGFENLQIIHHDQSKGGNASRNTGVKNAKGEILAFLDDDDFWLPNKLEAHVKAHDHESSVGLVYSDCNYVYNNRLIKDKFSRSILPSDVKKAMSKGIFCPVSTSIVSIKTECVSNLGLFDEQLVSFQDWDFWFRISHSYNFYHVPEVLVEFRQHLGERTSQTESKRLKGLEQICEKWRDEIKVKEFRKFFTMSLLVKNSRNALMSGKRLVAFKKSMNLLHLKFFGYNSLKSFLKLGVEILGSFKA